MKSTQSRMGNLPTERLQSGPPFNVSGVDYAGPFMLKDRKDREAKISKCYACLFVCFTIKAVHLELMSDLTKEAFISALRRFTARRGKPSKIFSDNGTNFVGAKSELDQIGKFLLDNASELTDSVTRDGIEWEFIPPSSPHFDGLWEAGVKSMKHHLRRVVGVSYFTQEEFNTLLRQVEAILNSRPLYPLPSSPDDLSPLTPAHFLIGRSLIAVPDEDFRHIPVNRLSKYQHIQALMRHFWERCSKEYISELQYRQKWPKSDGVLEKDALVLIKEDNQPPMKWRLGRIEELHPGKDGISRVASIRTQTYVRGVC